MVWERAALPSGSWCGCARQSSDGRCLTHPHPTIQQATPRVETPSRLTQGIDGARMGNQTQGPLLFGLPTGIICVARLPHLRCESALAANRCCRLCMDHRLIVWQEKLISSCSLSSESARDVTEDSVWTSSFASSASLCRRIAFSELTHTR